MEFEWVALAFDDVIWIALAFALGFVAKQMRLPPLVGFLIAGFILNTYGAPNDTLLQKLADIGITLLLFTVGLKLNPRTFTRPQVWAVSSIHMLATVTACGFAVYGLALAGAALVPARTIGQALLIAFALSFSSTVFVVKVLEEKGEVTSLHGRIAVGILVIQDIAAVIFLAASDGKLPSWWALGLFLLIPLRPFLYRFIQRVGHGELLVLLSLLLAIGGAQLFELVDLKGDLGALIMGALIASHSKADEIAKTMLGFKDLFLLGFFLSIGLSGGLSWDTVILGGLLLPLVLLKLAFFFGLFAVFKLRARTAFLGALSLSNFSEFGLIVAAVGANNGWIGGEWVIALSIALSLSFVFAAVFNALSHQIYNRYSAFFRRFQTAERIEDDQLFDISHKTTAVLGMGALGSGAYDALMAGGTTDLVGVDIDPVVVREQREKGREVILGDPSDADFWDRVHASNRLGLVVIAMPNVDINAEVLEQLKSLPIDPRVTATAKYPEDEERLRQAGAALVFNVYAQAGAGYVASIAAQVEPKTASR